VRLIAPIQFIEAAPVILCYLLRERRLAFMITIEPSIGCDYSNSIAPMKVCPRATAWLVIVC